MMDILRQRPATACPNATCTCLFVCFFVCVKVAVLWWAVLVAAHMSLPLWVSLHQGTALRYQEIQPCKRFQQDFIQSMFTAKLTRVVYFATNNAVLRRSVTPKLEVPCRLYCRTGTILSSVSLMCLARYAMSASGAICSIRL